MSSGEYVIDFVTATLEMVFVVYVVVRTGARAARDGWGDGDA